MCDAHLGAEESTERLAFYNLFASPYGFGAGIIGHILFGVVLSKIAERCRKPGVLGLPMLVPILNVIAGLHLVSSNDA